MQRCLQGLSCQGQSQGLITLAKCDCDLELLLSKTLAVDKVLTVETISLQSEMSLQVSNDEGLRAADEIGAAAYCECSARTGAGVREMFDKAVRLTLYDSGGQLLKTKSTNKVDEHSKRCCALQ